MILFLTDPQDTHAVHLATVLEKRNAKIFWFDYAQFPYDATISLVPAPDGMMHARLRIGEQDIDLHDLTAIWLRRPSKVRLRADLHPDACPDFLHMEAYRFVREMLQSLPCRWVPGTIPALSAANFKGEQLRLAAELGLEIPPTLMTNSPQDFLDFYCEHEGNIISKNYYYAVTKDATAEMVWAMPTQVVTPRSPGYAASVRHCPIIFQAYVPKRLELRVTVVGKQVFACEIQSQVSNRTKHDWRNYDITHTPHLIHALPAGVRERCVRLVERFGLLYGAIDLVLTPDGHYVFLEINPNGQYLWIEELTGLPISEALCDLLLGEA